MLTECCILAVALGRDFSGAVTTISQVVTEIATLSCSPCPPTSRLHQCPAAPSTHRRRSHSGLPRGFSTTPIGRPTALQRRWILVVKPPCGSGQAPGSESPFSPAAQRCARIVVLSSICKVAQFIAAICQSLQHDIPHARLAPAAELPPDRIPVAECLRQVAPRCACAADPQYSVDHAPTIGCRSPAAWRRVRQERRDDRPLFVRHQTASHNQPPP